jgi:hypothetical protein
MKNRLPKPLNEKENPDQKAILQVPDNQFTFHSGIRSKPPKTIPE